MAEMMTVVVADTVVVLTAKVALVAPAATFTEEGTPATAGLLLDRVTVAPPLGAAPLNVSVPVEAPPPVTVDGFKLTDETEPDGAELGVPLLKKISPLPVATFCDQAV